MTEEQLHIFCALIQNAVFDKPLPSDVVIAPEEQLAAVLEIAEKHSLLHLIVYAMDKCEIIYPVKEERQRLANAKMAAVMRYGLQIRELACISKAFEEEKIPFIPLKGAMLRAYYPQQWMRTSCDIDILVAPEHLTAAESALVKSGYAYRDYTYHDRSYDKGRVHVELHFSTIEESLVGHADAVMDRVWQLSRPAAGKKYEYVMEPELFLFYHIAHMAKHFINGGCGVRPLLDLQVMQRNMTYDKAILTQYIAEAGLEKFASLAFDLSDWWFGNGVCTEELKTAADYILSGGVYGTYSNHMAAVVSDTNRKEYLIKRLFPPFRVIKDSYPVLNRAPILWPLIWVARLLKLIFSTSKRHSIAGEIREVTAMDDTLQSKIADMMRRLELNS